MDENKTKRRTRYVELGLKKGMIEREPWRKRFKEMGRE